MARKKCTNQEDVEKIENKISTQTEESVVTEKEEKKKIKFDTTYEKGFSKNVIKKNPIRSKQVVKNLVNQYYTIQDDRIRAMNRKSSQKDNSNEESDLIFAYSIAGLKDNEEMLASWLEEYAKNDPIGQWLLSVKGIGPVLAAGIISTFDISKAQTAGAFWKYAGIDKHYAPRKKGEKFTYNPDARKLCWKIGEQFIKVSGYKKDKDGNIMVDENGNPIDRIPDALYGHLYREKLKQIIEKNEKGGFTELAALTLKEKKFKDNENEDKENETKKIYESGKLPMAHMISMARRYAEKIFLSHLHAVWYEYANGRPAPRPFAEIYLGHVHIIEPPHKEILGLKPGRDSF